MSGRAPIPRPLRGARWAALVLLLSCGRGKPAPEKTDLEMTVGPENVSVVRLERIRTGPELSGTLTAGTEAKIGAEVGGAVLQTLAEEGQQVRKGQLIARIDAAALREQSLSARSAVTTAQIAVGNARRDVERNRALVEVGAIPQRDVEQSQSALTAAEAQLANARAVLANANEQIGHTEIRAPFDGVVSERSVSAGDVVTPGAPLYTIVDPTTMRLEANVTPEVLSAVHVGAAVDFGVSGLAGSFAGKITRVNPVADPATRQVRVLVSIPNPQGRLVGGLFASGRVAAADTEGPVVPLSAVDDEGTTPFVVQLEGGRARKTAVQLGARDETTETVSIRSGVAAGDTVLLGAAREISEGTPVRVGVPTPTTD